MKMAMKWRAAPVLAWALFLAGAVRPAMAQVYTASDTTSLAAAINAANGATGPVVIDITSSITLSQALPLLTAKKGVTIEGNGNTISGNDAYRILFIDAGSSTVSIANLALDHAVAHGGNGADGGYGGGGGGGLGGALFVNSGAVTLSGVTFASDGAVGGNGGNGGNLAIGSGGGGGLGGAGGSGGGNLGGGGGGGGALLGGFAGGGGGGGGGPNGGAAGGSRKAVGRENKPTQG
ncbi:MAG: hypothetical protein ACYC61_23105 [Isosphaeraceae bacterium]